MLMYGHGILLLGESGMGKTSLCQALIRRGHRIVADDAVLLTHSTTSCVMSSPPTTMGKMVVGRNKIVSIVDQFGHAAWVKQTILHLVVRLTDPDKKEPYPIELADSPHYHISESPLLEPDSFELWLQNTIDCNHTCRPLRN